MVVTTMESLIMLVRIANYLSEYLTKRIRNGMLFILKRGGNAMKLNKVLVVLGYPRLSYFNDSGKLDLFNSKEGKLLLKILTAPRAGLGIDKSAIRIAFAINKRVSSSEAQRAINSKNLEETSKNLWKRIDDESPDLVISFGSIAHKTITRKPVGFTKDISHTISINNTFVSVFADLLDVLKYPSDKETLRPQLNMTRHFIKYGNKLDLGEYELVKDYSRAKEIFKNILGLPPLKAPLYKIIGIDFETNTLESWRTNARMTMMSISWKDHQGVVIPIDKTGFQPFSEEEKQDIKHNVNQIFKSDKIWKVLHNGKFDITMLKDVNGLDRSIKCIDTEVMYYVGFSQAKKVKKGLKQIARAFTDMGGYEQPLEEFKNEYLENHYKNWYNAEIEKSRKALELEGKDPDKAKVSKKDYKAPTNEIDGGKFNYDWIDMEVQFPYAAADADVTLRLFNKMVGRIKKNRAWVNLVFNIFPRLNDALTTIEHNGIKLDMERNRELHDKYVKHRDDMKNEILSTIPEIKMIEKERLNFAMEREQIKKIKPADRTKEQKQKFKDYAKYCTGKDGVPNYKFKFTPNDMKRLLYDVLGYELPQEPPYVTGNPKNITWKSYSVGKAAQEYLEETYKTKFIELYSKYSKAETALGSFIDKLPEVRDKDDFVKPSFNPYVTETSRLSSSGAFNAQNQTRRTDNPNDFNYSYGVKSMYRSRFKGGILLNMDYSALEIYTMAMLSKDRNMTQALLDHKDIHKHNASLGFHVPYDEVTKNLRTSAKKVSFGIPYSMGIKTLAKDLGVDEKEAQRIYDAILSTMPQVKQAMADSQEFAARYKYAETLNGFRRDLSNVDSILKDVRAKAKRQAFNTEIQGSGSNIVNLGLISVHEQFCKRKLKSKIIATVHDSILLDVYPPELAEVYAVVKYCCEHVNFPAIVNNDATGYRVPKEYQLPNNKFRFPFVVEPEIGINYNDEFEVEEEDLINIAKLSKNKGASVQGWAQLQYDKQKVNEKLSYKLIDEEEAEKELANLDKKSDEYLYRFAEK